MTAASASFVLTGVDLGMLEDLYWLGAATTPVLLLVRRSHAVEATGGLANHRRRLARLQREGFVSRFADRFGMVVGSRASIYAVESGVAALAAATRRHYNDIPQETWRDIRKRGATLREQITETLGLRGHDPGAVRARLDQLSTLCLRYYAGETTLRHRLLASTAAAVLWLGARHNGWPVHTVIPDGALALSVPDDERGLSVSKPDLFFGIRDTAVLLEAETGTSSRAKLVTKLGQYGLLASSGQLLPRIAAQTGRTFADARILVHCGTAAHAQLVADVASTALPQLWPLLRITGPADLSVEDVGEEDPLMVNDLVDNVLLANGRPVLAYFASRLTAPIFAAVDGRDDAGAKLRCTSLLGEGGRA